MDCNICTSTKLENCKQIQLSTYAFEQKSNNHKEERPVHLLFDVDEEMTKKVPILNTTKEHTNRYVLHLMLLFPYMMWLLKGEYKSNLDEWLEQNNSVVQFRKPLKKNVNSEIQAALRNVLLPSHAKDNSSTLFCTLFSIHWIRISK